MVLLQKVLVATSHSEDVLGGSWVELVQMERLDLELLVLGTSDQCIWFHGDWKQHLSVCEQVEFLVIVHPRGRLVLQLNWSAPELGSEPVHCKASDTPC